MKRLFTLLSILAVSLTARTQCSIIEVPLTQRTSASDLIVEGRVTAQSSFWNNEHTMIYTASSVELYKIFKGIASSTSIDVITEGGTVGYDRISVDPSLNLHIGDIGVFTCENPHHLKGTLNSPTGLPMYEPYGSVQGFVKYDLNNASAADPFQTYNDVETEVYNVVGNAHHYTTVAPFDLHSAMHNGNPNVQAPSISSFSPTTVTAGTLTSLTINGSGFGASQGSGTVGFKNADDGGATYMNPLPTQIVSWSNTQIVVKVPSGAGTGTIQVTQGTTTTSAGTLTVSYNELGVQFDPGSGTIEYQTDHNDDNGSGGYTWRMNTAFDADATERASFMRAFDTWRCNTGINWTIGATTSINDAVSDGTNCICNDNTAPLSSGILGVCYSYWSGCASGPTIIWYVNELDIIFDDGSNISPLTWQYGPSTPSTNQYDFESVAVHELGHGHQLGHVIASGQIMHYALSNGAFNRTLSANDLSGANDVQSRSLVANVCGPGAMTAYTGCAALSASGTQTNVSCNGGSNGTASVTASGGTSPYSYDWTPGNPTGDGTANVTGLTAGTWTCTVTDNASATVTVTFSITAPSAISLTANSQTNISCNGGSNGAASVNAATGGAGGFTYNWTPGNPTGDGTTSVTGLTAQTYTCTATDANGCVQTVTFNITAPSAISLTANSQTNVSCNGGSNGAASVNAATGGAGGFTYNWTPGNPTGDGTTSVTGLTAQTYTCTATDANGCTQTRTFNITAPSALSVSMSETDETCTGNDGTATALASGGAGSYTYSWSPSGGTAATATSLSAGTYTCSVTDLNGCPANGTVTVGLNCAGGAPVAAFSASSTSVCAGGTVSFTDLSSNSPTSWSWTFSGGTPASSTSQNPTITYNTAGVYDVTLVATNASGSGTLTITGYITVNANPTVTLVSETDPSCAGGSDGTATVLASGGSPGYTYAWAPFGGTAATASGLSAGAYICTATDAASCTGSVIVTVMSPNAVAGSISSQSNVSCNGGNNGSVTISASGGTPGYTYSWAPSGGTGATASGLSAGNYTCTITDSHSCTGTVSVAITQPSALTVTAGGATTICNGNSTTVTASSSGGTNPVSFTWMPGSLSGGSVSVSPSATTTYTVTGTDANGCSSNSNVTIVVNNCAVATVPCGATITRMKQSVSATNVPGAISYQFKFYNNSTGALVAQTTQASRTLIFTSVPGLYYNTTYKWTVAVNTGSGFGPESNPNCTITFGVPVTTVPCGHTITNMLASNTALAAGNVLNYKFSFYDNTTGALVAQKIQASNSLQFSTVSGLSYNTTYKWTVALEYPLASGGSAYGPQSSNTCTVIFGAPQTTVHCGYTFNKSNDYSTVPAIYGVMYYRYTFWQGSTMVAQYVSTTGVYIYFNQVAALSPTGSYTWTVECGYYSGSTLMYGPPSNSSCTITFSPSAISVGGGNVADDAQLRTIESDPSLTNDVAEASVNIYPNPSENGNVHCVLSGFGIDGGEATIELYDMLGNRIDAQQIMYSSDVEFEYHPQTALTKGMYMMRVNSNDQVQMVRLIVQ